MNWKKIVVFIIAVLLVSISTTFIYLRLAEGISFTPLKTAPKIVEIKTDDLVLRYPNIVGIQVVTINLENNIRYILYTSINDVDVKKLYDSFLLKNITTEVPVFTNNNVQNARIVRLMNHEFVCSPFADTISYDFMPSAGKYISTVCAIGIPPSYGNFAGIVGIFLKDPPTLTEIDILRIESRNLADDVWKATRPKN